MGLFLKAPIHKTVALLDESGKRELFWYGVTVGQVGFGFLVSHLRQPTKRVLDAFPLDGKSRCPECTAKYHHSRNCTRQ